MREEGDAVPDVVDPAVLAALDEASHGFVSNRQIAEWLDPESAASPEAADHSKALRSALLFEGQDGVLTGWYQGDPEDPWPREPKAVPGETQELWASRAEQAAHPGIRGHLHDLLRACGHGRPHLHARGAIVGYREGAVILWAADEQPAGRVRAVHAATDALDLARTWGQLDLRDDVVKDMLAMAEDILDLTERMDGLLHALLERPRAGVGAAGRAAGDRADPSGRGRGLGRSAELLLLDSHGSVTALTAAAARQPVPQMAPRPAVPGDAAAAY